MERAVICFGAFQTYIVGVQYYSGTVSRNEQVRLVRAQEPLRPQRHPGEQHPGHQGWPPAAG